MEENKVSYEGSIEFKGGKRRFSFDGKKVRIFSNKVNQTSFEYAFEKPAIYCENLLIGITVNNILIYFIDVKIYEYKENSFNCYPKSYCISKNNMLSWDYEKYSFSEIALYSNAISSLQNCEYINEISKQILKKHHPYLVDEKLMPNDDMGGIQTSFKLFDYKCILYTSYVLSHLDRVKPIEIRTSIKINSDKGIDIFEIYQLTIRLNEAFKFIFNRKNISYNKIVLTSNILVADFIDNKCPKPENIHFELYNIYEKNLLPVKNYCAVKSCITEHLEKICEKGLMLDIYNYYPLDDEDSLIIDIDKFIKMCGAFEREFDLTYPKWTEEYKPVYFSVKTQILDKLKTIRSTLANKKEKKKCDSIIETVEQLNERLESRLEFVYSEFNYCLAKRFSKYCRECKDTEFTEIASKFAKRRNTLVHTFNLKEFNNDDIVGYLIVRDMVYCLVLKRCEFTKNEIENMLDYFENEGS